MADLGAKRMYRRVGVTACGLLRSEESGIGVSAALAFVSKLNDAEAEAAET